MNSILVDIRNGQYDMLIGLATVAILMGCVLYLLHRLSRRTKRKAAFESIDRDMTQSALKNQEAGTVPAAQKVPWEYMSKSICRQILSVREEMGAKSENAVATKTAQEKIELRRLEIELQKLDNELAALKQPRS
jgi:hypothetical protein